MMNAYRKRSHPKRGGWQEWEEAVVADTLNVFDNGESRTPVLVVWNGKADGLSGGGISYSITGVEGGKQMETIVRRLTPEECEILQGYPVGWTDIGEWVDSKGKVRQTTDSARYKALGNSICLPPWKWVLKRICATYERDATMGSLFDGIGGFPYLWEQLNYPGSCLWASEIEEFPIAVTERRINGKENP